MIVLFIHILSVWNEFIQLAFYHGRLTIDDWLLTLPFNFQLSTIDHSLIQQQFTRFTPQDFLYFDCKHPTDCVVRQSGSWSFIYSDAERFRNKQPGFWCWNRWVITRGNNIGKTGSRRAELFEILFRGSIVPYLSSSRAGASFGRIEIKAGRNTCPAFKSSTLRNNIKLFFVRFLKAILI